LENGVANLQVFKDGVLLASTSSLNPTNSVNTAVSVTKIGDLNFDGVMGEIIIYDRVLSTPERQQVESYLSPKWRI